jgi:hypothetical protein
MWDQQMLGEKEDGKLVGNLRAIRAPAAAAMHLLPISIPSPPPPKLSETALTVSHQESPKTATNSYAEVLSPHSHQMVASRRNGLAITRQLFFFFIASLPLSQSL